MTTIRGRLLALQSEADADAAGLATSLADVRSARSDGTTDDEHDPEGSTLTSDWSQLQGLSATLVARRAQIENAISRLDAGTYGTCTRCGQPISGGRLEARPAAEHCIDCAEALERR